MALQVDFKNRIGYYTLHSQDGSKKWKIWFCHANALCAEIYFRKDENGEERANLHCFFADIEHLKRCAKDGLLDHYKAGITLYSKEMDNDLWKMARIFAESGIKVTIK